jgi:ferredoxin-NADP reductase
LVLVGGGIGVTPLLPILSMVADVTATQNSLPKLRCLVFVWSVRSPDSFEYAAEELRRAAASIAAGPAANMPTIEVRLHLTVGTMPEGAAVGHIVECCRPDVSAILSRVKAADDAEGGAGAMGFVCGPSAMTRSVCGAGWSCGVPIHAESFDM